MSSTRCCSLYGEIPPQSSPSIRKNGSIPPGRTISSHGKQRSAPRSAEPYNTQAWVWKMDHPCFFDFFCWIDDVGDSRLDGGTFSLSGSGGNASRLPCDSGASLPCDIHHSSRPDPENNPGRCRKECDTTCTGFDATAKQTRFRTCNPPKTGVSYYPLCWASWIGCPKKGPKCQLRAFCLLLSSIKPKFYQKSEPNPNQK